MTTLLPSRPMEQELKHRLPSPQGVALAIMTACRREDVSVREIAMLVQSDPALAGRLLDQANSAAAGGRAVTSVHDAVARMGLQSVRQLALGFSLIDQYAGGKCAGFDYPGFWSHALLMGLTMKSLGELCRMGAPDELFTCGLLARIGNLALATAYPLEYALVLAQAVPDADLLALERQSLQTDHLHLSGVLLAQWGIPNSFLEAVQFHETPMAAKLKDESRPLQLLQALHLAWRLSNFLTTPLIEPVY